MVNNEIKTFVDFLNSIVTGKNRNTFKEIQVNYITIHYRIAVTTLTNILL